MDIVYLWALGPMLLFAGWVFYLVFAGHLSRNVVFRTRVPGGRPARGRVALLVNVVVRDEPVPDRSTV